MRYGLTQGFLSRAGQICGPVGGFLTLLQVVPVPMVVDNGKKN
ncbi:hypothetical protein [Erwinia psidii]|nr:hypothetical protein [Erwinia psidii]